MRNNHSDVWSLEELEKAKPMWEAGNSASEIAAVLPRRSRCAVIGVATRQGWKRASASAPSRSTGTKAPNWSAEEAEQIKTKWLEGKSATEIVSAYPGRTPAAVIALAYRMGLKRQRPSKPETAKKQPKQKVPAKERQARTVEQIVAANKSRASCASFGAKVIEAFPEPANDTSMLFWKRGRYQCAWPVGDGQGAQMMCCGRPVDPEATETTKSYCSKHRAIASTGIKQVQKVPREANVIARRGPSRSVWDGGRVA